MQYHVQLCTIHSGDAATLILPHKNIKYQIKLKRRDRNKKTCMQNLLVPWETCSMNTRSVAASTAVRVLYAAARDTIKIW